MDDVRETIKKEFHSLPSQDRSEILHEIRSSLDDKDSSWSAIKSFQQSFRKLEKIKEMLELTGLERNRIQDSAFRYYSSMFMGCYVLYIISSRRRWYSYLWRVVPIPIYHVFVHDYCADWKGLYKSALFGNDAMSQEIRLLLSYYYPEDQYAEVMRKRIKEYNQKATA